MRTRVYVVIGLAILLLGPMQGWTQFPQGGGGGRGGGRGGGFNMDPGARFDQMTNGKGVWVRSEITDQRQQFLFDRIAQNVGATNGQITRDQYVTAMQQMMANWGGGGRRGGGQTPTTPGTPGAPTSPGDTRRRDRGSNPDRANSMAEAMFRQFDQNQDGYLNSDEMPEALRTELDKWDTDKNGLIDLNEFKAWMQARIQQRILERSEDNKDAGDSPALPERKQPVAYRIGKLPQGLPDWFTQLDTDQDAQIGLYEWKVSGRSLDEFNKIDRNGDGFLTVDEVLYYEASQGRGPQPGQGGAEGDSAAPVMGLAPGGAGRNGVYTPGGNNSGFGGRGPRGGGGWQGGNGGGQGWNQGGGWNGGQGRQDKGGGRRNRGDRQGGATM
jgi:Ca2+-binding EF-hand superfamily protein